MPEILSNRCIPINCGCLFLFFFYFSKLPRSRTLFTNLSQYLDTIVILTRQVFVLICHTLIDVYNATSKKFYVNYVNHLRYLLGFLFLASFEIKQCYIALPDIHIHNIAHLLFQKCMSKLNNSDKHLVSYKHKKVQWKWQIVFH